MFQLRTVVFALIVLNYKTNCQVCQLPTYTCDPEDPTKITILNTETHCNKGEVCNDLSDVCNFCVDAKAYCQSLYTCNANGEITMKGTQFKCEQYYECDAENTYYENNTFPCKPCKRSVCSGTQPFKCLSETKVLKNNLYTYTCPSGYVCNANFYAPCDPCITKDKETVIPTTTIQPATVDCNDGKGASIPCRADSRGNSVYYACIRVWATYTPETRQCSDLKKDATCYKIEAIRNHCLQ